MQFEYLGPYQIQGVLGRGGMGTVYKGIHSKTKEAVAVKVIASTLADQERFRRRFAAEIEMLKRLKHPNIVQLVGYGEEKGHLFYSMEYVAGESLHALLGRVGKLDWKRVINIGIEICDGLKQAHNIGVIHRDLKPANIMVTEDGHVKLTDFGIAKLFGGADATVAGAVIGTADFMPPEQAEGKPVTVRSDLYALGSLSYTAIAGRPPFIGGSLPEVLHAVRYSSHIPLRKLVPDVPMEVAELIDELLAKKPGDRPPTALVVGNRLQALRVGLQNVEVGKTEKDDQQLLVERASQAKELTSIDLNDLNRDSLLSDAGPTMNEGSFEIRPGKNYDRGVKTPQRRFAGPEDVTRVATPSQLDAEAAGNQSQTPAVTGQTRFTEVEERDRARALAIEDSTSYYANWIHWTSIAVLVGLILFCLGAIWKLTRPPTADQLYATISAAAESGDENSLMAVDHQVDRFIDLYPNDARRAEIDVYARDIELARTIRRIMRRARAEGGTQVLQPIEQAFLDCVELKGVDAYAAAAKLQSFLAVFGPDETLSRSHSELVETARYLRERILTRPNEAMNPAAVRLEEMVRSAKTQIPRDRQAEFYQGIIDLYGSKAWAAKSIAEARRELERLKGPAEAEGVRSKK